MQMKTFGLLAAGLLAVSPAFSADRIKIGVISTLTGPGAVIGREVRDGMNLALENLGGKIGGLPAQIIYEDDQQRPEVGRQVAQKLIEQEKVDIVAGVIWSNVMMAVFRPITQAGKILIGTVAGPSPIAGEQCSEYFFSSMNQGDASPEAMGEYLRAKGVKNLYLMAPNYQAGRDMLAGVKRFYKGSIAGEVYTPLTQVDFAAELTQLRNSKAEAVFVFYPGGSGIQFVKQFAQAGLKGKLPLYSVYTVNNITLPAQGEAAMGMMSAMFWAQELDNEANRRFVSTFAKKHDYLPSEYTASNYDAIMLLDSAVRAVNGRIEDTKALMAELKKAKFASVRGTFEYANNGYPKLDYYLVTVGKDKQGRPALQLGDKILDKHGDSYGHKCRLK